MRNKLNLILRGGAVKRYHVMDTIRTQTVAEHSFGVAWLVWILTDGALSADLLLHALAHDLAEHVTGDLPAPAKRSLRIAEQFAAYEASVMVDGGIDLPPLSAKGQRTLKFADTCELLLHCLRELALGNTAMEEVFQRGWSYIGEMRPLNSMEFELTRLIGERHNEIRK